MTLILTVARTSGDRLALILASRERAAIDWRSFWLSRERETADWRSSWRCTNARLPIGAHSGSFPDARLLSAGENRVLILSDGRLPPRRGETDLAWGLQTQERHRLRSPSPVGTAHLRRGSSLAAPKLEPRHEVAPLQGAGISCARDLRLKPQATPVQPLRGILTHGQSAEVCLFILPLQSGTIRARNRSERGVDPPN